MVSSVPQTEVLQQGPDSHVQVFIGVLSSSHPPAPCWERGAVVLGKSWGKRSQFLKQESGRAVEVKSSCLLHSWIFHEVPGIEIFQNLKCQYQRFAPSMWFLPSVYCIQLGKAILCSPSECIYVCMCVYIKNAHIYKIHIYYFPQFQNVIPCGLTSITHIIHQIMKTINVRQQNQRNSLREHHQHIKQLFLS